jgi:6-phosphofructokinase 1
LIYLPELTFDLADFISKVEALYKRNGDVMVAVSEGIMDKDGTYISAYFSDISKGKDAFGHAQMGGLAASLAHFIGTKIDAKVRGIEFGIIQRCAAHLASATDIDEAYMAGKAAFDIAFDGMTDKMVAFKRGAGPEYTCEIQIIDLIDVANVEKKVPREWINEEGTGMKQEFIDYALPLIQGETNLPKVDGLPRFAQLKKVLAK